MVFSELVDTTAEKESVDLYIVYLGVKITELVIYSIAAIMVLYSVRKSKPNI